MSDIRYPLIWSRLSSEPWAGTPESLHAVVSVLQSAELGEPRAAIAGPIGGVQYAPVREQSGGLAVIPVSGIIGKHLSRMEQSCGGCSLDVVSEQLAEAEERSDIQRVILHIDSPGGAVTGVPELAEQIAGMRTRTVAFVDSMAASAGYYLAAAADEIIVTRSAILGSIGVRSVIVDSSRMADGLGITVHVIDTGAHKSTGQPGAPVSEEQLAWVRERVDAAFSEFSGFVQRRRPQVSADLMDGRTWYAAMPESRPLWDRMVESIRSA